MDDGSIRFGNGDMVFREGDPSGDMYLIVSGSARVFRTEDGAETMLALLKPGEYFGEMALFDEKPRSATIQAEGDLVVKPIGKDRFRTMVGDPVVWDMLVSMSNRLRQVDDALQKAAHEGTAMRDGLSKVALRRNLFY